MIKQSASIESIENEIPQIIVLYELISGILELVLGFGILIFGRQIIQIYHAFKAQELLEDPHDLLIRVTQKFVPFFLQHRIYVITFLLLLGVTKIAGALGLYYKKHWGMDLLIGLILVLLPFDLVDFFLHPTSLKVVYIAINILIALYLVHFNPQVYLRLAQKYLRKIKLLR